MQFLVLLLPSLLLHVFRNTLLIAKLTNRIDEITLRPKLPTPKRLLHRRHSPEYLAGCYTLDRLNNRVFPVRLREKFVYFFKCDNVKLFWTLFNGHDDL